MDQKCENCVYWNLEHCGKAEGVKGCSLWNNFKHFGKSIDNLSIESFDSDFYNNGPTEAYEGWVRGNGGIMYNNSIITQKDGSCSKFSPKQKKET